MLATFSSQNKISENKVNSKKFLYNVGETDFFNFDRLIKFSNLSSYTEPSEMGDFLPLNKPKDACFTCFKLSIIDNSIYFFEKLFCSENCKDKFFKENLVLYIKIF